LVAGRRSRLKYYRIEVMPDEVVPDRGGEAAGAEERGGRPGQTTQTDSLLDCCYLRRFPGIQSDVTENH
jgi:hypothetical protein